MSAGPKGVGDFSNIGQKVDKDWVIERGSTKAIQWCPTDTVDPYGHPELLSQPWVDYKQSRIRLPIPFGSRHFYDPSADELVIFQVHTVELEAR